MKFMSWVDPEMGLEVCKNHPGSGRPAEVVSEELEKYFSNSCHQDVIMEQ